MRRREFIAGLGAAAAHWPSAMRAQQPTLPVVGLINGGTRDEISARLLVAFRTGLGEFGYVDRQNVSIEYHYLDGQFDRLPALLADLIRRPVAVIATPGTTAAALAAKSATATIPVVFSVGDDPVRLGLVASLARPGGNATGLNNFFNEASPKRLGLLHELVPTTNHVAVLVNPSNMVNAEATLQRVQDAARSISLVIDILKASTSQEIEDVFAALARGQARALFVANDVFFASRRVQLVTLATRLGIATAFTDRVSVEIGGLMSYGSDVGEMYRQTGAYTGQILKGAKPADLPVVQSTKFEFVINMQTARALGIQVPPGILASADVVIE